MQPVTEAKNLQVMKMILKWNDFVTFHTLVQMLPDKINENSLNLGVIAWMVSKSCNLFKGLEAERSDSAYDSVDYDQVKTESSESQAEAEELNQSQSVRTCIFLMVCPSASASDSVWFSLGHKGNEATESIKQSRKKW